MRAKPTVLSCLFCGLCLVIPGAISAQVWDVDNQLLGLSISQAQAMFGGAIAVGDFDGDSIDDLVVGAPLWDTPDADDGGSISIYLGEADRSLVRVDFFRPGSDTDAEMGEALAAGDFDGDGRDEIAVGAPAHEVGTAVDAGIVWVFDYESGSWDVQSFDQSDTGWSTPESSDRFGETLTVGDFNTDGYDDLAVGSPFEDWGAAVDAGCIQVYYGTASGLGMSDSDGFAAGVGGMSGTGEDDDLLGFALTAGDFDGDGYSDLAVGAPGRLSDAGQVHVLYGSSAGITTTGQQLLEDGDFSGSITASGDRFGEALAAHNFDESTWYCILNTCYADLAIGVPGQQVGTADGAGKVMVGYGGAGGVRTTGHTYLSANVAAAAPEADDWFGAALAAGHCGPPTFFGFADLAVGTPYEDYALSNDGYIHLFYGASGGIHQGDPEQPIGQHPGFGIAPAASNDRWGSVMAMGDFDGDGHGDLAVGVPLKNDGSTFNTGYVQVLYGGLFADGFEPGDWSAWTTGP